MINVRVERAPCDTRRAGVKKRRICARYSRVAVVRENSFLSKPRSLHFIHNSSHSSYVYALGVVKVISFGKHGVNCHLLGRICAQMVGLWAVKRRILGSQWLLNPRPPNQINNSWSILALSQCCCYGDYAHVTTKVDFNQQNLLRGF